MMTSLDDEFLKVRESSLLYKSEHFTSTDTRFQMQSRDWN